MEVTPLSKFLHNDRLVLIMSFVIALALWVGVASGQNRDVQRTFPNIPLTWRNLPENLSVVDTSPETVDVTLRGDREIMSDLSPEDFVAAVNLSGASRGAVDYFVTVSVPRGVQLVQVEPQTVTVELEQSVEEVFQVSIRLTGTPEAELAEPTADPAQVVVNGPMSRVEQIAEVQAEVEVDGLDQDLRERVVCTPVDAEGNPVRGVLLIPRQVDVLIAREETQVTRQLPVKPVMYGELPPDRVLTSVTVRPRMVSVTGPEEAVEQLDHVLTEPIDLTGLDLDDTLEVEIPVGTTIEDPAGMRIDPQDVVIELMFMDPDAQDEDEE